MKKILAMILSVLLLAAAAGCAPVPTEPGTTASTAPSAPATPDSFSVDWEMTAYMVNLDGTVETSFPFQFQDTIRVEDPYVYHKYVIRMPEDVAEDFRYFIYYDGYIPEEEIEEKMMVRDPISEKPGDFMIGHYIYDKENNDPAYMDMILNTDKEYLLVWFEKGNGPLLVACADPSEGPADVLAHYQEYLRLRGIEVQQSPQ